MDGASAEIVRDIINKQSEMDRELADHQVTKKGRLPLRVTVFNETEQDGPSDEDSITEADIARHLKPIGRVLPQRRVVSRPQTPDSMPELELIEDLEEESSDSEGEYIVEEEFHIRPTTPEWI